MMTFTTYLDEISTSLKDFSITKSDLQGKDETAVQKMIFQHLKNKGLKVAYEKQVGFLKFYVDIDYKDGKACIEVKLADKLVNDTGNTGELQRLLGQTFYYTKNYKDLVPVVMILVVGDKNIENDHKIQEIKKYIKSMDAEFKYIPTKET